MKNRNWIRKISNTYIQLNESNCSCSCDGGMTNTDIFDENLWQNLVAGMNQQQPTTPTTTTTRGRRVATGGASSTT
jgi:hypothetical protein